MSKRKRKLATSVLARSDADMFVRVGVAIRNSDAAGEVAVIGGIVASVLLLVLSLVLADSGMYLAAAAVAAPALTAGGLAVYTAKRAHDDDAVLTADSMWSRFGYEQLRGETRISGVETWQTLRCRATHLVEVCPERHDEVRNLLFEAGVLLRDAVKCDDLRRQAVRDGDSATAELWRERTDTAMSTIGSVQGQMSAMLAEFATSDRAVRIVDEADKLEALTAAALELRAV